MKKREENKKYVDPGRMNHRIEFYELEEVADGFGGVTSTKTKAIETWGHKRAVSLNQVNQLGLVGAENDLLESWYVTIRARNGFTPDKAMTVTIDGSDEFTIRAIQPLDDPTTFIQLVVAKNN